MGSRSYGYPYSTYSHGVYGKREAEADPQYLTSYRSGYNAPVAYSNYGYGYPWVKSVPFHRPLLLTPTTVMATLLPTDMVSVITDTPDLDMASVRPKLSQRLMPNTCCLLQPRLWLPFCLQ